MQTFLAWVPDTPDIYRTWAVSYIGLYFSHLKVCRTPFQILEFFQKMFQLIALFSFTLQSGWIREKHQNDKEGNLMNFNFAIKTIIIQHKN